jgi:hypothetical protein
LALSGLTAIVLCLASFVVASGPCLLTAAHNDREGDGLCGPVREVRQTPLAPGGSEVDGRWPAVVKLYDPLGTLMATFDEPPAAGEQHSIRVRHELDERGRIVRSTLGRDDSTSREVVTFRFEGLRVTEAESRRGGTTASSRTVFEHDAAGRLVRARTTAADGSLVSERRASYDANGQLAHVVETEAHDEGLGVGYVLITWSSRGDGLRATHGLDGRERDRMLTRREWDPAGNWVRAVTYQCPPGATDTATCSEERPVTREIAYYLNR